MKTRYFALGAGMVIIIIGILAFIPGLLPLPASAPLLRISIGYGYWLGLFPVNLILKLIYLAVGVWGIVAYRQLKTARIYARSLTVLYGLLAVLGLIPVTSTFFGLIPLFGHDIWLHALIALVAAYFGFIVPRTETQINAAA